MRFGRYFQTCAFAAAAMTFATAPALAGDPRHAGMDMPEAAPLPAWKADRALPQQPGYALDARAREDWLAECRRRVSARDSGVGGAVIGGLFGGIAGNRIAGRGHRTVGTVTGAAVGAVAGMAIDKAEDRARVRDECETYLDQYYAAYAQPGYAQGYYPAAYAQGCACARPAAMVPARREPACTETVEYEYVDVPARPARRYIPRRATPDKRIRIAPDKRVPR